MRPLHQSNRRHCEQSVHVIPKFRRHGYFHKTMCLCVRSYFAGFIIVSIICQPSYLGISMVEISVDKILSKLKRQMTGCFSHNWSSFSFEESSTSSFQWNSLCNIINVAWTLWISYYPVIINYNTLIVIVIQFSPLQVKIKDWIKII